MREDMEVPVEGGADLVSTASVALKADRYRPRIYGFQLHETAKLQRWQGAVFVVLFWKAKMFLRS
jgi:casein kinase II subunit beta